MPRSTSPSASSITGRRPRSSPTSTPSSAPASAPKQKFGTTLYWLIDAVRNFGADEAARVFRKAAELRAQYPSIIGIGIGGDEARGPASLFKELYAEAKAAGLRLTAHAGESGGPIDGPASIWAAINIGAERIGHGLAAQHDPELLEVLAAAPDPHRDQRHLQHPHRLLHQLRRPPPAPATSTPASWSPSTPTTRPCSAPTCSTNTSSPTTRYDFTLEQLRELAANAVEASFLPPTRKLALLAQIEQYR